MAAPRKRPAQEPDEPAGEAPVEADGTPDPEPPAESPLEPDPASGDGGDDPDGDDGGPDAAGPPEVAAAAASPLSPPAVRPDPNLAPHPGDSAAAPSAVARTAPGPHLRLLDDDGNEIDPDDVFLPQSGPSTLLTVRRRVYQEFRYPGTRTPVRQLLLNGGTTVPIPRALQMIAEIKAVAAELAAKADPAVLAEPEQAAI